MKTVERLILKYTIRMVYLISSLLPVRKRVVFATNRTDVLADNFKFIYQEMKSQELDFDYIFLLRPMKSGLKESFFYFLHLLKATYYLATSSFFLVDDYYFPIYVVKLRKGTEVVQVWHACGAFKKFGYSVLGKSYGADDNYVKYVPIHKNYSHVLVSSKEVIPHYAEAFNMDETRIHPMGIPRTDLFFNETLKREAIEHVYNKYPELKGKKIILYAPTFRGVVRQQIDVVMPFDLKDVANSLEENMILGLKMHPFVSKSFDLEGLEKVINLSDYPEVNDLLLVTDLLISDYSSLVFEFSLLERPMIFYAHDRVDYITERDFYYEYENFVPGPIVETTEELVTQLKSSDFDLEKIKTFKSKFFDKVDGGVTQRFIEQIILK